MWEGILPEKADFLYERCKDIIPNQAIPTNVSFDKIFFFALIIIFTVCSGLAKT